MNVSNVFKSALPVAVLSLLALGVAPMFAATTTTATFTVSATVPTVCTINANPLTFGNYTGTEIDLNTTLSVNCTKGGAYSIGLSKGNGANATTSTRSMTGAVNKASLNYSLYSDAGRTQNWDDISGNNVPTNNGTGSSVSVTVYGQIPANQALTADTYSDSVTATISY